MKIVTWKKKRKRLTKCSADSFFEGPLPEITLFKFKTGNFCVDPHGGAFSLKMVMSGEEKYFIDNRRIKLDKNHVVPVNSGQRYGSAITTETESLSIFYSDKEVKQAAAELCAETDQLLDNPDEIATDAPETPQIKFALSSYANNHVEKIDAAIADGDAGLAKSWAQYLLRDVLASARSITPRGSFPSIRKKSTRDELLNRVLRAREYIDAQSGRDCSLEMLADIACMSKYHFLRIFREVFGVTPVIYARRQRLVDGIRALERGKSKQSSASIAGYANYMLFERAHIRAFGRPPSADLN